jgi:hypothetical protein
VKARSLFGVFTLPFAIAAIWRRDTFRTSRRSSCSIIESVGRIRRPNKSPEPTGVVAFFLFALDFWFFIVTGRRWLSFFR